MRDSVFCNQAPRHTAIPSWCHFSRAELDRAARREATMASPPPSIPAKRVTDERCIDKICVVMVSDNVQSAVMLKVLVQRWCTSAFPRCGNTLVGSGSVHRGRRCTHPMPRQHYFAHMIGLIIIKLLERE